MITICTVVLIILGIKLKKHLKLSKETLKRLNFN